jgi:hypothetical protein
MSSSVCAAEIKPASNAEVQGSRHGLTCHGRITECVDIALEHRVEAGNVFLIGKVQTKHTTYLLCFKKQYLLHWPLLVNQQEVFLAALSIFRRNHLGAGV